jgi:hypothetical protein
MVGRNNSRPRPRPEANPDRWLRGATAIGKELGIGPRAVSHLLNIGALPARMIGGRWTSTPRRLHAHVAAPVDAPVEEGA